MNLPYPITNTSYSMDYTCGYCKEKRNIERGGMFYQTENSEGFYCSRICAKKAKKGKIEEIGFEHQLHPSKLIALFYPQSLMGRITEKIFGFPI